jgi:hypothetical protein
MKVNFVFIDIFYADNKEQVKILPILLRIREIMAMVMVI